MDVILILVTALLPVALLLYYIYKTDLYPEPSSQLVKAFFYGVIIVLPAVVIEVLVEKVLGAIGMNLSSLLGVTAQAFFVAALPEEGLKLLALWLLLRKNRFFDEHIDGIVYAVYVSLGFAAVENISYLFSNYDSWVEVGFSRALLAVPGHYAFGVLMGFFYSLYYFVNRSKRNKYLIFVAPFTAHGIYDTFAFSNTISPVLGGIGFVGLVLFCVLMHRFCRNRIGNHLHRDGKLFGMYHKLR
jgi:RsiW-degrading membrane proteinase PrsW (M82 family)